MISLDAILLILLVVMAIAISTTRHLTSAIVIFAAYSVVKSVIWILLTAPDLAITEAAVSAGITGVLFFIVLKQILVVRDEHREHDEYRIQKKPAVDKGTSFRHFYNTMSVIIGVALTGVLLYTVAALPPFGDPSNPTNNEVPRKFIEDGIHDTGALNVVASMLFSYRAFDTLGEAAVLIAAVGAVLILLRSDGPLHTFHAFVREMEEPRPDIILKYMSFLMVGMIMIFGCYVIMNGHLTPGGGFSGGAILGASLVLYVSSFGTKHAYKFLNYKICCRIMSASLIFYIVAKGHSFFTGANQISSNIPIGTPGNLFSAGLIMPLNISIGLIVACSIYMIFILFGKGVLK